jgi:hypothetical protein
MLRNVLVFTGLCAVLALTAGVWGEDPAPAPNPQANDGAEYIGADACKKCHIKQHRSWMKMKHAKTWENLPAKFQTMDAKDEETGKLCVSCHVTAFGEKGGFVNLEGSKHLLGVQCEACHGPGGKHKPAGQKVMDEKREKFNPDEKTFITLKTVACSNCHNPHVSFKDKYGQPEGG